MFTIPKMLHEIYLIVQSLTAICLVFRIEDEAFQSEIIYNLLEQGIKNSYHVNIHTKAGC